MLRQREKVTAASFFSSAHIHNLFTKVPCSNCWWCHSVPCPRAITGPHGRCDYSIGHGTVCSLTFCEESFELCFE